MAAPKNNQFWKLRSSHGRPKAFSNPEDLWNKACEYFEWSDSNKLKEQKVFGNGKRMTVKHHRPYTLKALYYYLEITETTYLELRKKEDFYETIEKIDQVIYSQKFEGAAVGLFNANIISRDLGLKDATDITTDGKGMNDAFAMTVGKLRRKLNENDKK